MPRYLGSDLASDGWRCVRHQAPLLPQARVEKYTADADERQVVPTSSAFANRHTGKVQAIRQAREIQTAAEHGFLFGAGLRRGRRLEDRSAHHARLRVAMTTRRTAEVPASPNPSLPSSLMAPRAERRRAGTTRSRPGFELTGRRTCAGAADSCSRIESDGRNTDADPASMKTQSHTT